MTGNALALPNPALTLTGPTGPIASLAGLQVTAGGKAIPWQRDPDDMFAFHLDVPAGAATVEAAFDFLLSGSSSGFTAGAASSVLTFSRTAWRTQVVVIPGASSRSMVSSLVATTVANTPEKTGTKPLASPLMVPRVTHDPSAPLVPGVTAVPPLVAVSIPTASTEVAVAGGCPASTGPPNTQTATCCVRLPTAA